MPFQHSRGEKSNCLIFAFLTTPRTCATYADGWPPFDGRLFTGTTRLGYVAHHLKTRRPARVRAVRIASEAVSDYMPPVCFKAMWDVYLETAFPHLSNNSSAASPSWAVNASMNLTPSGCILHSISAGPSDMGP